MLLRMANRALGDVGGTPGGLGEFALGFVMACVGGYLLFNQVTVAGSYWVFWGANSFGISLIPQRDLNVSAAGGWCGTDCPFDALT